MDVGEKKITGHRIYAGFGDSYVYLGTVPFGRSAQVVSGERLVFEKGNPTRHCTVLPPEGEQSPWAEWRKESFDPTPTRERRATLELVGTLRSERRIALYFPIADVFNVEIAEKIDVRMELLEKGMKWQLDHPDDEILLGNVRFSDPFPLGAQSEALEASLCLYKVRPSKD